MPLAPLQPSFRHLRLPLSSFPRRRESRAALLIAMDSRLRGNDGVVHLLLRDKSITTSL